jgi:hypothetical protein
MQLHRPVVDRRLMNKNVALLSSMHAEVRASDGAAFQRGRYTNRGRVMAEFRASA